MARCNCGNQTCSCVIIAGDGISLVGNGSPTRPYEIGVESATALIDQLGVSDHPTLDLTIDPPVGGGKVIIHGVATQSMRTLTDVLDPNPPINGDVPTWVTNHWEFLQPPAGGGGGVSVYDWGTAPLDDFGASTNMGQGLAVYLDSNAKLRAQPLVIDGSVALANADPITRYPIGLSVYSLSSAQASAGGWQIPFSGTVVTVHRADGLTGHQWYHRNTIALESIATMWRSYNSTSDWSLWRYMGSHGAEIGPGVNLDTLVSVPGSYVQSQSAEATLALNYPVPVAGLLEVFTNVVDGVLAASPHVWQRYTTYLHGTYPDYTYLRSNYNGTWGTWRRTDAAASQADTVDFGSVSAGSSKSQAVVFAQPFYTVPVVTISPYITTPHARACGVDNVTTTGFTAYYGNFGSQSVTGKAGWIAQPAST